MATHCTHGPSLSSVNPFRPGAFMSPRNVSFGCDSPHLSLHPPRRFPSPASEPPLFSAAQPSWSEEPGSQSSRVVSSLSSSPLEDAGDVHHRILAPRLFEPLPRSIIGTIDDLPTFARALYGPVSQPFVPWSQATVCLGLCLDISAGQSYIVAVEGMTFHESTQVSAS